jgi:DNA polymerase III epsilon subunit-like protein
MKQHNYCILDFETSGLDKVNNYHSIVCCPTQVAVLAIDGNTLNEIGRYKSYIKGRYANGKYIGYSTIHDQHYQEGAFKATGISAEKLETDGKEAKQVCLDLCNFFESTKSTSNYHKTIIVGANVGYDIPFLQYMFSFFKKDLSKYLQGYYDHKTNYQLVNFDTQFLSKAKSTDESLKHNLTDVALREGFEPQDMHDAMNDVVITSEIFKKYIMSLRNASSVKQQGIPVFRETFKFEY